MDPYLKSNSFPFSIIRHRKGSARDQMDDCFLVKNTGSLKQMHRKSSDALT